MRFTAYLFLLVFCFLFSQSLWSQEIEWSTGLHKSPRISGCCQSSGFRWINSINLFFQDLPQIGQIEIEASTSGRWSSLTIGPSYFLLGSNAFNEASTGDGIKITQIKHFNLIGSFGMGLLLHNATTIGETSLEQLPKLIWGTLIYGRLHGVWSLTDRWSLSANLSTTIGFSKDYLAYNFSIGVGPRYRF